MPATALHGIHTERAIEDFPLSGRPVRPSLIHAYGAVKQLGYDTATEIAEAAARECKTVRQIIVERALLTPEQFDELTGPERVMQLGSRSAGMTL